jgi:hypothetical protein
MLRTDLMKKREVVLAIHRHWFWADRIREEYYERQKANPPKIGDLVALFLQGDELYKFLWYGLLFSVCEALRAHKILIPNAQKEIDGIYESLKLFRNAIFHIQPEYFSKKLFKILNDPDSDAKIRKLHYEIGDCLSKEISGVVRVQAGGTPFRAAPDST